MWKARAHQLHCLFSNGNFILNPGDSGKPPFFWGGWRRAGSFSSPCLVCISLETMTRSRCLLKFFSIHAQGGGTSPILLLRSAQIGGPLVKGSSYIPFLWKGSIIPNQSCVQEMPKDLSNYYDGQLISATAVFFQWLRILKWSIHQNSDNQISEKFM